MIRHSTAHVMAQAVQQAFPEAKLGIGPPVENGFYYDFQVDRAFTPDDFAAVFADEQLSLFARPLSAIRPILRVMSDDA